VRHDVDNSMLALKGIMIGRITTTVFIAVPAPSKEASESTEDYQVMLAQVHRLQYAIEAGSQAKLERDTLLVGMAEEKRRRPPVNDIKFYGEGAERWMPYAILERLANVHESAKRNDDYFSSGEDPSSHSQIVRRVAGRSFIVTEFGYAGSVESEKVSEGDVLVLLFWCRLPGILTPRIDGTYEILETVFVYGLRRADFLEDEGMWPEMEFVLR
jgi:hypothetical protein